MMIFYAILTFLLWACADLFYKMQASSDDKFSHLKTGIMVGLVMGVNAVILAINNVTFSIIDMIKYLPVSLCYISSMVIGYKGLRYLNVSIASPIENTSGIIATLLLLVVFKEQLNTIQVFAICLIAIGVIAVSYYEGKKEKQENQETKESQSVESNKNKSKKILILAIFYPLMYCLLDGLGTFLDSIYLDKLDLVTEDTALIVYEVSFFIYALLTIAYIKIKGGKLNLLKDKYGLIAAILETIGQNTYVYAMSANSIIAAPIVGSYCIGSVLLGNLILKEKEDSKEKLFIMIVIIGIIILGFYD